jgi:hypothetical protein
VNDFICNISIHAVIIWNLSLQLMSLCKKLEEIWKENEGTEVLFLWTQFLKEDSLKFLKVTTFIFSVNENCNKGKLP